VSRLLERKPARRLGMLSGRANDIKRHKWFEGLDWEALAARKVEPPRKPKEDSAKRLKELTVRSLLGWRRSAQAWGGRGPGAAGRLLLRVPSGSGALCDRKKPMRQGDERCAAWIASGGGGQGGDGAQLGVAPLLCLS
jgi:hypothetical protein